MQIGVIGLSFKTSPLSLREEVMQVASKAFGKSSPKILDCCHVLLPTCNRLEIYFSSNDLSQTHVAILRALRAGISHSFAKHMYSYFHAECFAHLARVTSGLESAIVGESDIQRQIKRVYADSLTQEFSSDMHFLFQKALKISKQVRSEYLNAFGSGSLERTILSLLPGVPNKVLFIGNSMINRSIYHSFKKRGLDNLEILSRFSDNSWERRSFKGYPLIICGTHHKGYVINPFQVDEGMVIDLGVPRNVNPKVNEIENCSLFHLDELTQMIADEKSGSQELILSSELMIKDAVKRLYKNYYTKKLKMRTV